MIIKWIQRGLLGLMVAASLYASAQNLISTKALGSIGDDPVADWEKRFVPLKAQLPFRRGVVGYISDSSIRGVLFDPANTEGEYVLTQYVMAPIIIIKGTNQEWNIARFDPQGFQAWSRTNQGKFEVTPFKGGVYLLHRIGN